MAGAVQQVTTMEDAIGVLVDTITSVLLVFEEAASDTRKKVAVGATEQLADAVGMLAGIAEQISSYIDPQWKAEMQEATHNIRKEQALIASYNGSNLESHEAEQIHACIKRLMTHAVKMMCLNDLHQVRQTTNTGKMVAELLARLSRVENADQLLEVGREAVPLMANLKELFFRRLKVVSHPMRMKMLQRSMDTLTSHSTLVIELSRDYMLDPTPAKDMEKKQAFTLLIKAIIDGMEVIEASSDFLQSFDIEFFFPGGGGYRKPIDPELAARLNALAGQIGNALGDLSHALQEGDAQKVVQNAHIVAQGMKEAMELARALAAQMDDPVKKAALLEAASTLEWIAPELLKVTKALLDDPTNPELLRRHADLMDKANNAVAMIKLAANVGAMEPLFAELFQAIAKGDEKAAMAACDKIEKNIDDQIAAGKLLAENTKNPLLKQKILDSIATLEQEKTKLRPAVQKTMADPSDQAAKDALQAIVNNIAAASNDLADAAIVPMSSQELSTLADLPMGANAMEREAIERAQAIHDALDKLLDAVKRGDAQLASEAMKEFIEHAKEQVKLARQIAADVTDPALRQELLDAADKLEALVPQLQTAVDYALAHPDDVEAQQRVKDLVRQCKDESAKISNAVVRAADERVKGLRLPEKANATERAAVAAAAGVFKALDDMWDAVLRGDAVAAYESFGRFKAKAEEQIRLAREMAANCKDPVLKRKLEVAADKLEKLIPQVEEAMKAALANPKDPVARQRLADLMAESKALSSEIAALAVDASKARLEQEEADRIARLAAEEAARARAAAEAAKPKPTMVIDQRVPTHVANALQRVDEMANMSKFGEDTHQGQLIKASRLVADILQEFSLAAENLDKKGMIAASRKLVEAIKDVNKHAQAIGKDCTDTRLTESLLNIAQAPQNYGTQLKLVAAVKSNTHNDIRTAKGQMYAAAKNIADALTETIRTGEMAAMKSTNAKEAGFAVYNLKNARA